jgi:hypothetical protein
MSLDVVSHKVFEMKKKFSQDSQYIGRYMSLGTF